MAYRIRYTNNSPLSIRLRRYPATLAPVANYLASRGRWHEFFGMAAKATSWLPAEPGKPAR